MLPPYSQERLIELCKQYHVQRLSLFGSRLKGTAKPDSDIDMLVVFEPGKTPGLDFFGLEEELESIFDKKVDLNTYGFLSEFFRDEVVKMALPIYVA
jgi:uncharacterized protein